MKEITIKTQKEWDALPLSFPSLTYIYIKCDGWITINKTPVSSHVEARGSSHVEACGSSHVEAWESSHVEAWGSSHVEACGSSHVEAWESSHVVAWESSHVEARGSSHVVACGSSHVEAWESSHVEARGEVAVHVKSEYSTLDLFGFAVCILLVAKCKLSKKSKTCTVIIPEKPEGNAGWLESEGVETAKGNVTLFKRVSSDLKTQEGTTNETLWKIGSKLEHKNWNPGSSECGAGKFHACSRPYFCDEFRLNVGDRYVAISVSVKDLYAWPNARYPHKIAFRTCKVLHECNKYGERV